MSRQFRPASACLWGCLALCLVVAASPAARGADAAVSYSEIGPATGVLNSWNGYLFGAGAALEDLDNDGDVELLILNAPGTPNRLFRNDGDPQANGYPTLTEITDTAGLVDLGNSKGIVVADMDNDGHKDVFIATYDESADGRQGTQPAFTSSLVLYHNNGDGTFTDRTVEAGLQLTGVAAHGLSAADVDQDGWVDILLCNRGAISQRGGFNFLFHNNGDGTFTDVSTASGIGDVRAMSFQSGFFDYDNDGDQDVYLCTDKLGGNQLYRNDGHGVFENVSVASQSDIRMNGMCVAIGDYDNDLDLDVFVTNTPEGHALLRNNNDGTFTEVANAAGVLGYRIGWGGQWMDADNDGWLDLYVVGYGLNNNNQLFSNQHNGTFTDIAPQAGCVDPADGYGLATGDLNGDGKEDFFVSNFGSPCGLYQHSGSTLGSLRLQLVGIDSNRDAIGARVQLTAGPTVQIREVRAGDSYLGHSQMELSFGIGTEDPDRLDIRWPSGLQQTVEGLQKNSRYRIVEGHGIQTATLLVEQSVEQNANDVTLHWETVQWPSDQGFRIERLAVGATQVAASVAQMSDSGRWFSWTDDNLTSGTYRYRVFVVHENDTESLLFETGDVVIDPTPVRLQGFEIAAEETAVTLRWGLDAAAVATLRGVHVQRATSAEGPFTDLTTETLAPRRSMRFQDERAPQEVSLWYRLRFLDRDGTSEVSLALQTRVGGLDHRSRIVSIAQASGAPVQIAYVQGRAGWMRLEVFDIRGRLVDTLLQDQRQAGRHSLTWTRTDRAGRPVARGLYVLRLQSPAGNDAHKLVLLPH